LPFSSSELSVCMVNCWKFWFQHKMHFFENNVSWHLVLFLVFLMCTDTFVWKFSWLFIMKFTDESIYWRGIGRMSSCLHRLLYELLVLHQLYVWQFSFLKWNSSHCWKIYLKNYSIIYNRMKICILNWFESVNVTDVGHWPNSITCST